MKLYPCQKIALAEMDDSSDRTNDGIWTYRVRCALTHWGASIRMPEEYTKYSEKDLKEEYEKQLIYLLCKGCDWRGEEMTNLSDGVKDGLVLFYMKNRKLHSVLITQDQAEMLDISLGMVFGDKPVHISPANDVKKYLYESEE